MEEMNPLPDSTKRNGIYYLHVRVPKALILSFGGKRFITESLGTKDRKVAQALLYDKAADVRRDFKQRLAEQQKNVTQSRPITRPSDFADIARQHGREIAERELLARVETYQSVIADTARFWRGEIVPLPCQTNDLRYFDHLVAEGDLDRGLGYIARADQSADR